MIITSNKRFTYFTTPQMKIEKEEEQDMYGWDTWLFICLVLHLIWSSFLVHQVQKNRFSFDSKPLNCWYAEPSEFFAKNSTRIFVEWCEQNFLYDAIFSVQFPNNFCNELCFVVVDYSNQTGQYTAWACRSLNSHVHNYISMLNLISNVILERKLLNWFDILQIT